MNARFRHLRIATLCSIFLALISMGILAALAPQASIAQRGNTANALAINAALSAKPGQAPAPSRYLAPASFMNAISKAVKTPAGVTTVSLPEPVQTFDVFAPAPDFTVQGDPLTYANRYPNWTSDESSIVFASNRPSTVSTDPPNRSHIWIVSADGGAPTQLTSGSGNEFYPVLSPTNRSLAFTSNANSPAAQNLYVIPFSPNAAPVSVNTQTSLTIRNDIDTGFSNVGRPAWSPTEDRLAFTALTTTADASQNHTHVYYLYAASGGYQPAGSQGTNPPGRLTSGAEDDADVAWSPDGRFIAFSSTSTGFQNSGDGVDPTQDLTPARSPGSNSAAMNLFALTSDGLVPNNLAGGALTTDNNSGGAAWGFPGSSRAGFLAFHRKVANVRSTGTHFDIFFYHAENGTTLSTEGGAATKLNTDDGQDRNNTYPTWAPQQKHLSIAYSSDRSITYNNPVTGAPSETALSLLPGAFGVGANYTGILESEVDNINPPVLLRFNDTNTEIVHVNAGTAFVQTSSGNPSGSATRSITPGTSVTFAVRLSSREAGVDPNNVYIQIKDPDSKAQDSQNLEHKVFTHDQDFPLPDSGSEEKFLHNLGITDPTQLNGQSLNVRGPVGGVSHDSVYIGVGQSGGGTNVQQGGPNDLNPPTVPGDNPDLFNGIGQEFEAQFVKAAFAGPDTITTDYGAPFFLAGVDDRTAHSAPAARPEWLKLTRAAAGLQDAKGGLLYTATWKTPTSPSDYYLDVISYDNAQNWRIFDNVWGFSTQTFAGDKNILVVNDNGLGQKFIGSTFGSQGAQNLRPTFFGAESYFTEVDPNILPTSVFINDERFGYPAIPQPPVDGTGAAPTAIAAFPFYRNNDRTPSLAIEWAGTTPPSDSYTVTISSAAGVVLATSTVAGNARVVTFRNVNVDQDPLIGGTYSILVTATLAGVTTPASAPLVFTIPPPVDLGGTLPIAVPLGGPHGELSFVENALGVGSAGSNRKTDAPSIQHQYNIWRILSRGPVRDDILLAYASKKENQPSVSDGTLVDPAADIPVATRCVIWSAPYAGQLFVGAGSIASPETQQQLATYVGEGGRLFLSGGHIASALTADGTQGSSFLTDVLGADFVRSASDIQSFLESGANSARITFDPHFNFFGSTPERVFVNGGGTVWGPPSSMPLKLAGDGAGSPNYRTDSSLGQFGPSPTQIGPNGGLQFLGSIDVVNPLGGFVQDITYPGGGGGLQYGVNPVQGSKTIFASFGLEGIGTEYYSRTYNGVTYYFPYNMRQNLMHNIVVYLRTGSFTGTIRDAANGGGAVSGATVYLTSADGTAIPNLPPGRDVYSAVTNTAGRYTINGVEPGTYIVHAYKNQSHAVSFTNTGVTALSTATVDLNLQKEADGSLNGHVTNLDGTPANNATVTFTAPDGTIVTAQTNNVGFYTVQNVPSAPGAGLTYTGFASKFVTPFTYKSDTATLIVVSNKATTTDFILRPPPGRISGKVTDASNGQPLSGVKITITSSDKNADPTVPISLTTDANGNYTTGLIRPATYEVAAVDAPHYVSQTLTRKLVSPQATLTVNIALAPVRPGRMGGIVTDSRGVAVSGATVTLLPPGGTALTATTNTSGQYLITGVPAETDPGKAYYATASKGTRVTAKIVVKFTDALTITQNFQLPEAPGVFSGTVTDAATGAKLSGVTLVFTPKTPGGNVRTIKTNAAGQYTTGAIFADTYDVTLSFAPSYQTQVVTGLVLPQDTTITKDFTLNQTRPGRLTGIVTDSRGVGAPFATVTFKPFYPGATVTGTTDANGRYQIDGVQSAVDPGKVYTGSAQSGTRVSPTANGTVKDGGITTVNFQLPEAPGFILGTVTDSATGAKLAGVRLVLTPKTSGTAKTLTTDANGQYKTGAIRADTYTITLSATANYQVQSASVVLPQDVVVTKDFALNMTRPGSISGVVTDSRGAPVAGATVTYTSFTGSVIKTTTDTSGRYTLTNVESAVAPGKAYNGVAQKGTRISPIASINVNDGAAVAQNFQLPEAMSRFIGSVTDAATGAKLSGVTLTFTPRTSAGTLITVTSNADGLYSTGSISADTYILSVSFSPNYLPTTITGLTLPQDTTVTVPVKLTHVLAGKISGLVSSPSGVPVPGATVTFTSTSGVVVTGKTGADGTYTIANVTTATDPGLDYSGTASKGDATTDPVTITLKSGAAIKQDFTLEPPQGTFVGKVIDGADSKPIAGATITFTPLEGADKTPSSVTTGADGAYTSSPLNFGHYKVTATRDPKYVPVTVASVYLADSVNTTQNFTLTKTPAGSIGGTVTFKGIAGDAGLVAGATVFITPDDGTPVVKAVSTATSTTVGTVTVNYQANLAPGTYTVTVQKTGYTSSSSVPVTIVSNEFKPANVAFDPIHTFKAGTQMISAPFDYTRYGLDQILGVGKPNGADPIAIWQPSDSTYVLSPNAPADTLRPGLGYWTKFTTDTNVYFQGLDFTTDTVKVPLKTYWNQIGVPSLTAINVSELTFLTSDNETLNFAQASAPDRNIVDKTLFGYDPSTGAYVPVTAGDTLSPWQGYWIKVYKPVTILLPTNVAATGSILGKHAPVK